MRIPRFLAATSLAVASVFFATSAATAVMPDGWQDPIQVSNMAVRHGPFLATSGESTMAVWKGTDDQGYFSVTTDGGATWGAVSSFSDPQHSVQLIAITSLEGGGFAVGYVTTSAVYVRTVNALGTSWSSFISQSADSPDAIILAAMTTEQVAVGVRAIDSTK